MYFPSVFILALILGFISACQTGTGNTSQKGEDTGITSDSISKQLPPPETNWFSLQLEVLPFKGHYPKMSSDGKLVFYTNAQFDSLWAYRIEDKYTVLLTGIKGAGFEYTLDQDKVYFSGRGDRKNYSMQLEDIRNGITEAQEVERSQKSEVKAINQVRISEDMNSVILQKDGQETRLQPLGMANYLNAELSPTDSLILLEVSAQGGFITDLDGTIRYKLGDIDHPIWLDEIHIAFLISEDREMETIKVEAKIKNLLTGEIANLTEHSYDSWESLYLVKKQGLLIGGLTDGTLIIVQKANQL